MTVKKEKGGAEKRERKDKRQKRYGGKVKVTRMGEGMEGKVARMEGGSGRREMKLQRLEHDGECSKKPSSFESQLLSTSQHTTPFPNYFNPHADH